ncbi:MAG: type II toxin-antitoxin system MqsA family antitoxin [Nitrospirales bacterium]
MTRNHLPSQCPLCGGTKKPGKTTFTAELDFGIVVVRSVPALQCSMCGADWIQDEIAARLELIVNEAKQKRLQVEVTTLA